MKRLLLLLIVAISSSHTLSQKICEGFECEGYAYVHSGKYSASCWIYGEKLDEGLAPYVWGELATTEWQGTPGLKLVSDGIYLDDRGFLVRIRASSNSPNSRCMLRGTQAYHMFHARTTSGF